MDIKVMQFRFRTEDGKILISQSDYDQETDNHVIVITPTQVDLLCELLQKAKKEVEGAA